MTQLSGLRLTGAKVLCDGALVDDAVSFAEGRISDGRFAEVDLRGYYILPGIVDLHGDGFEHHLQPRPNVYFDKTAGLRNADAELAANGVTTAILAQCWSWLGGKRSPEYALDLFRAWAAYKPQSLVDIRFQIRYETHMVDTAGAMLQALQDFGIDYLVFNNHIHDAANARETAPLGFAGYAAEAGRTEQQHNAIVDEMLDNAPAVDKSLKQIAAALGKMGVRYGSHDDETARMRRYFAGLGADICEFPTTREAAAQARDLGNPILMGAPNVMRGGSQSGNIAALDLIEAGLCDALVSDYYYPALQGAVWALVDRGVMSFGQAWGMISTIPAAILGLTDRGELKVGTRADFVIMNSETRCIEATLSNGRIAALSGEAGARLFCSAGAIGIAAE